MRFASRKRDEIDGTIPAKIIKSKSPPKYAILSNQDFVFVKYWFIVRCAVIRSKAQRS